MNLRGTAVGLVVALAALALSASPQQTNQWRRFTQADGLAENACLSVTLGAGGDVLVRHPNSNVVSVLDGYEVRFVPGPDAHRRRVFESAGGQFWTVAPDGLLEFRDEAWTLHRVTEIADFFRAGRTNEVWLLPVRQGRVLILLPDRLLQFTADAPEAAPVELLRGADQVSLGMFTFMQPARDGGLWIRGEHGYARVVGSLRNLKANAPVETTSARPPEFGPGEIPLDSDVEGLEFSALRLFDIVTEPNGALWLAGSDGLCRRAPAIWERTPVEATHAPVRRLEIGAPNLPEEIAKLSEWKISLAARNGDHWLAGANQIAWQHKSAWKIFSSTNQIGPEQVLAFVETPDGRICCATPEKVWEFDGRDWLASRGGFDHVNAFCCARDGTLWVASNAGLFRGVRGAWVQNDVADGLPSSVVADVGENEAGAILATTAAGVSVFQPEADDDPPRTFIRPLAGSEQAVREGTAVRLSFDGRDKWNQTTPSRLLFSYRLDEREWSPFAEVTEVAFTDLPVGKHYFQVRAMDRNANIDPKAARLEFAVVEPWYRETRLVFILSVALAVAVFFAGLAFNRHRKLQRSYAEVERQVAQRTRELERANRELLHSQKMTALGTLAAGIAHDFNNILSIVRGSAQIIEENPGNEEKIRTRLDRIKTVVQQGAGIVEAMLGFGRSSDERGEACDVNAVVDDTVKLLGDRFLREVQVRLERAENLPPVFVPRDFVQQVLLNFIFNAAEAMNSHKTVVIATKKAESLPAGLILAPATAVSYVSVAVKDSGCGIPPENLSRIFEPFFTTKALSSRRGTGLGLSMVYELAKKLEAGLAVESVVGTGSTFTIFLPVQSKDKTS